MPELPEVETVRRTLLKVLLGKTFTNVKINYDGVIKRIESAEFSSLLQGKKIKDIRRRGKYLLLDISGNMVLVVHFRMTGRLVFSNSNAPEDKHTHVVFYFSDESSLYFKDIRKFGTIYLLASNELHTINGYAILGPEPLTEEFIYDRFRAEIRKTRKKIKQLLLDQTVVAGIGNIYADEILHASQIHPERICETITEEEGIMLYDAIIKELSAGVADGGTSFRDYVDGFGEKGDHQNHLKVYQKHNMPCPRCGATIARIKVSGRSSYHCPHCQK
jgi:formamidopyrimidine-DNA glycosylase